MPSSNRKTIIFCGTSTFAVPSLQALSEDAAFDITAVITQPDKPVGRKQMLTPSPVKELAARLNLLVFQPEKLRTGFKELKLTRPDFLVVVSYGQILSQEILDFPTSAPMNVHASLLPKWRGASPLHHAILNGDAESGVTIQHMVKELDAGPILAQKKMIIDPRETTPSLHDKLAIDGAALLVQTLLAFPVKEIAQDASQVTLCGKLTKQDGEADAEKSSAEEIDRRVRALNPWPGVTLSIDGERVKLLETSLAPVSNAYEIACAGSTTLYAVKVQPESRKPMSGADFARGKRK